MKLSQVLSVTVRDRDTAPAMTVAICSNRVENLQAHLDANVKLMDPADRLLIVLDTKSDDQNSALVKRLQAEGITVISNNGNLGLSYSRNTAIHHCTTRYIVFVDDDVTFSAEVLEELRNRFSAGANVAGVRISLPADVRLPWYISRGQLHYLGAHDDAADMTIWGACMGMDLAFVRRYGLRFRPELGRRGKQLQSGDDTTFVAEMKKKGAQVACINSLHVLHHLSEHRRSLSYLIRRVYWQGRSEVRRSNLVSGARKEWSRYHKPRTGSVKLCTLAVIYLLVFLAGAFYELVVSLGAWRCTAARF
jgi:glycosyltransferase involved in cell wall biosynthesis